MAGRIKVLNKEFKALGSTSGAFNVSKTEELMREFTLDFSVVNNDSIFSLITEDSVFEYAGQMFDVTGIDGTSGETNITQVTAEHISYRLSEYTLPNGYSFAGTVPEIANDILNEAKTVDEIPASSVFTIGQAESGETFSFATDGNNVTARAALIAMSELGVEIEFDNFTVNVVPQRGADNGMIFSYDRNLAGVRRTWQKENGWSYEITMADLQKIPGHEGDVFALGDYVTVKDTLLGVSFKQRVISYTECDDPSQNKVTAGVFVRDSSDVAIETDTVARNSVQEGERYSNVSITHTDGFKAVDKLDQLRVLMNADDCFVVQAKQSDGTWKTVTSTELWGVLAPRLTTQEAKEDYYATVGKDSSGAFGTAFYIKRDGSFKEHFRITPVLTGDALGQMKLGALLESEGNLILRPGTGGEIRLLDSSGNTLGITTTFPVLDKNSNTMTLKFKNGLLTEVV